jgi:hypothetical protein
MSEGVGEGRFSTVWAAKELTNGQQVAIKVRRQLLQP